MTQETTNTAATTTTNMFELPMHSITDNDSSSKVGKKASALRILVTIGCLAVVAGGAVVLKRNTKDDEKSTTRDTRTARSLLVGPPRPDKPQECDISSTFDLDNEGWLGLCNSPAVHDDHWGNGFASISPYAVMCTDDDDESLTCPLSNKALCGFQSFWSPAEYAGYQADAKELNFHLHVGMNSPGNAEWNVMIVDQKGTVLIRDMPPPPLTTTWSSKYYHRVPLNNLDQEWHHPVNGCLTVPATEEDMKQVLSDMAYIAIGGDFGTDVGLDDVLLKRDCPILCGGDGRRC